MTTEQRTEQHRVYLDSLTQASHRDIVARGLEYAGFGRAVSRDSRVFLKPNLTYPTFKPGVMTTPETIGAAIDAVRAYTPHVYIGDADSGGYNRFSMDRVYRDTGIAELAEQRGARVVNLSHGERRAVPVEVGGRAIGVSLPRLLTDEIDVFVTLPVPKVHNMTGVSVSFKNQWGCIPEPADRLRLHPHFDHVIAAVNRAVKTRFSIVDGTWGLNDNGPMRGRPVRLDWLLVASDPGAADRVACELMRVPVEAISHLRHASRAGMVPDWWHIETNTDLSRFVGEPFVLDRQWTDMPGFLAFHSRAIAWLAYASPFADVLHKLLYLVREPFYDYEKYKTAGGEGGSTNP